MAKPQGTYSRIQNLGKMRFDASESKVAVRLAKQSEMIKLYAALDDLSAEKLDGWHRSMAALVNDIKNSEAISREDKTRRRVSEVLEEVRKVFEKAQDYKQLEGRLQVPVYSVMRTPRDLGVDGAGIGLIIALCQILEVFIRLRPGRPNK